MYILFIVYCVIKLSVLFT